MSQEECPFQYLIRVRYAECDAQGVVFNARYGDYVDTAATEFYRALFGGYEQLLAQGLDTQVVNYQISWQAPARFDQVLAIAVTTSHVGNSSFTLTQQISDHSSGSAIAEAQITYVLVNTDNYAKTPVPDSVRDTLERGAPGQVINHAGVDAG